MLAISGCNADVSEVSVLSSSENNSVEDETQLLKADTNIKVSFVKNGERFDLNKNDKIKFELKNNTTEILTLAKISDKKSNCSASIKKEFSSLKDNSFILCKSYIKRLSLTNVFIERNGKEIQTKSWKFSNEDKELIEVEIKVK